MKILILVSVCLTFTLPSASYSQDSAAGTPVGFIQEVRGNVVLCNQDNCDANSEIKLRPDRDEGRILFDNQSLKCEDKSVVKVHTSASYPGKAKTQFAPDLCIGEKSSWIHMPASKGLL